jgi:lantibiotic modifying enzyme
MSHGCAGIAWALSELYGATGDERCRDLALRAIAYERTRFDAAADNWRDTPSATTDVRPVDERATLSIAWCYGAPGIGLARAKTLRHFEDRRLSDEVRSAVRATLSSGFGHNHCLCHGDLGNLDFLASASAVLGDDDLRATVDEIGATVLHGIRRNGWICGVPLGVASPALMNGLSGIGYGLLRIAAPERVPSVLALEPLPPR